MGTRQARRTTRPAAVKPRWGQSQRTLYVGDTLVKHFKQPAEVQEAVCAAFEAQGWRECIANPLQPKGKMTRKARLHNAIKNLNRKQLTTLIHFYGDGTGQRICWRLIEEK